MSSNNSKSLGLCTQLLDTSGERCPKPVLLTRQALKSLEPGEVLKIIATDPQASKDFEIFCQLKKFKLVQDAVTQEGKFVFYITK